MSGLIIACAVCLIVTRMLYLWLGLDPTVAGYPSKWLLVESLIFVFQLATAFIQTGLFKFHKRDFKTSRGSSDDSKTNTRASATGSSLKLSMAAATKGDSTAADTLTDKNEEFDQNDNSSEDSSESKASNNNKEVAIDLVPTSPAHDEKSAEKQASESSGCSEGQSESNEPSSSSSGSQEEQNDSKNSSSASSRE